jgi:uncharacterized protein YuzE
MVIKYDKESDIIYIQFSQKKVVKIDEDKPGIILDYGDNGEIVGIEASKKISQLNGISHEVA